MKNMASNSVGFTDGTTDSKGRLILQSLVGGVMGNTAFGPGGVAAHNTWEFRRPTVGEGSQSGGFDTMYQGYWVGHAPTSGKYNVGLVAVARDTNGDGWISAGFDGSGGCTLGLIARGTGGTGAMPAAFTWQDTLVCTQPQNLNFTGALTEHCSNAGGIGTCAIIKDADPSGPQDFFGKLSIEQQQDLLNSVDATDVTRQNGQTVLRVRLTEVTVDGESYRPHNLVLNPNLNGTLTLNSKDPALKLLAAWLSSRLESDSSWSFQFNDAVTVDSAQMAEQLFGSMQVQFGGNAKTALRRWATSR